MARVSVIIPAYNAALYLPVTLRALAASQRPPDECIVVDDHSAVDPRGVVEAALLRVTLLRNEGRRGASATRNAGAAAASGEILVFVDADVAIDAGAIGRMEQALEADPDLGAITGSYDDHPSDPAFLSQYRNLLHAYYHHQGVRQIQTWWAGCGAVRREIFERHRGFDPEFSGVEDVEFGFRMSDGGVKIVLDPRIQGQHLKAWTLGGLIRTDIWMRGVPWTELILRRGSAPNDLNTGMAQRLSLLLTALLLLCVVFAAFYPWVAAVAGALFAAIGALNHRVFRFFAERRGWWFALRSLPCFVLYLICGGFGLVIGIVRHFTGTSRPRK